MNINQIAKIPHENKLFLNLFKVNLFSTNMYLSIIAQIAPKLKSNDYSYNNKNHELKRKSFSQISWNRNYYHKTLTYVNLSLDTTTK